MRSRHHRLDPCCYLGPQRYFLTFCADRRQPVFRDGACVASVLRQILHAATERAFSIIAYVVMPDHVHLLVEGLDVSSDLRAFANLAKQRSGYAYKQSCGRTLWQPSYWDRVLRSDESTWGVARHICDNPVRKRLVERWDHYEFVGSGIMTREEFINEIASRPPPTWRP